MWRPGGGLAAKITRVYKVDLGDGAELRPLEPSAYGRGLITKAVRLLIDWALVTRGLYRVEWICRPDNVASSNVARRLGMTCDGTLRASYPWKGVRHDSEIWSVLAPDWPTPDKR